MGSLWISGSSTARLSSPGSISTRAGAAHIRSLETKETFSVSPKLFFFFSPFLHVPFPGNSLAGARSLGSNPNLLFFSSWPRGAGYITALDMKCWM